MTSSARLKITPFIERTAVCFIRMRPKTRSASCWVAARGYSGGNVSPPVSLPTSLAVEGRTADAGTGRHPPRVWHQARPVLPEGLTRRVRGRRGGGGDPAGGSECRDGRGRA